MSSTDRRTFLQGAGVAGLLSAVSPAALSQGAAPGAVTQEKARLPEVPAKHSLRFAVIEMLATSEPDAGSESANAAIAAPLRVFGSH